MKFTCYTRAKHNRIIVFWRISLWTRNGKLEGNLREECSHMKIAYTNSVLSVDFVFFTIKYDERKMKKYYKKVPL